MSKNIKAFFDEMGVVGKDPRLVYRNFTQWLAGVDHAYLTQKTQEAELLFRRVGITFNVYGEDTGAECLIPFDVIPA